MEPTTLLTDQLSTDRLLTPALLIDAQAVDANIEATLSALGGDARRWRPHVKTAKLAWTIERLLAHGARAGSPPTPGTVNLFDSAILLDAGRSPRVIPVAARGHEATPA